MSELWKPITNYEGLYEVSSDGRIRNANKVVLKPQKRKHGYLSVWLYKDGGSKQVSVHRIVAEAFCEKKDGANEVNHLNENKQDNRADNLVWCTRQENCNYGSRSSTIGKKNTNGKRSKPVKQYTIDGEFVKEYPSMHEARRQTGFAEGNIHKAIHGKYSHAYGYKWQYS